MRRLLVVVLVLLALAAGVAGLLLLLKPRLGPWCARQISAIVDAHLRPDFEFDSIAYQPPATVTLGGVRLSDKGTPIIRVDSVRIELAEVPRRGRPLLFKDVAFDNPVVRLIPGADGSLLGFSDLVKPGAGGKLADGGSTNLTDVLRIETIRITGGALSYEPPGEPAMVLKPLTVDLERHAGADPGWYAFDFDAALDPVVQLQAKTARLNLDNGDLDLQPLTLQTKLTEQQYKVFTPSIQKLLAAHQIVGDLEGSLKGTVGLGDTSRSDFDFRLSLMGGRAVFGGFEVPIDALAIDASYRGQRLELSRVQGDVFNGHADASAWIDFGRDGSPLWTEARGTALMLQDLMQVKQDKEPVSGDVTFNVELTGKLDELPASLSGSGKCSVENGRLALVSLFQNVLRIGKKHEFKDRANGTFTIGGQGVAWEDFEIVGQWVAVKGKGDVRYDGTLDLEVNAGAIERLEVVLGKVGELLGGLAGGLVKYQVTGTLREPKVAVRPLGIGME